MRRDLHPLSIAAQQDDFARALLWRTGGLPAGIEKPGSAPPAKRFGIYRNNVFASLTACLEARFPVVARLVGDEFFSAMARVFIERSPPTSPALIEYGEEFAAFLATFAPAQSLPYLPDVARLEWRICAAYHAADAAPIDAAALARLGEHALDAALDLHPSCALLASHHAVFSIWRANTHDASVRPVDASGRGGADRTPALRGERLQHRHGHLRLRCRPHRRTFAPAGGRAGGADRCQVRSHRRAGDTVPRRCHRRGPPVG
ncbi:MAG: DNA-binding domain-containing protein [Hyphomicrobium sp.]|nr:DNA-binding domain-containing protein [Hyphomicrobium sp.]